MLMGHMTGGKEGNLCCCSVEGCEEMVWLVVVVRISGCIGSCIAFPISGEVHAVPP